MIVVSGLAAVPKTSDMTPVSRKEFLDIQEIIECGISLIKWLSDRF